MNERLSELNRFYFSWHWGSDNTILLFLYQLPQSILHNSANFCRSINIYYAI